MVHQVYKLINELILRLCHAHSDCGVTAIFKMLKEGGEGCCVNIYSCEFCIISCDFLACGYAIRLEAIKEFLKGHIGEPSQITLDDDMV